MQQPNITSNQREFIDLYFAQYSARNKIIKNYIDLEFSGLDGITNTIYNREGWLKAIDYDFAQQPEPFNIKIAHFESQKISDDLKLIITVSSWDLNFFKDFPEFDRIRTVFLLREIDASYKIKHLSNSVSLQTLERDEVYPLALGEFLKSWRNSLFGMGKKPGLDR